MARPPMSRSQSTYASVVRAAAAATASASRRAGLGEGSTISGRVVSLLATRGLIEQLASRDTCVFVSGTNGKTTTTALIARGLAASGPVATNAHGSNLLAGLYAALIHTPSAPAVLEVDELVLPKALETLHPTHVVLLNLSRDQLDRAHEVRRIAARWRGALAGFTGVVVANADDPLVVWSALGATRTVWVSAGQRWRGDAESCPACGASIDADAGTWRCTTCDLARPVAVLAERIEVGLPGAYNEGNAALASAVLTVLGVPKEAIDWSAITSVAGRYESIATPWGDVRALLAKNPAGWVEVLDLIRPDVGVVLAINDRIEDGRDPSWLWDVPFEQLAGRQVVCTGSRATDLAVRMEVAGAIASVEHDPMTAIASTGRAPVDFAANYSAFRETLTKLRRAA